MSAMLNNATRTCVAALWLGLTVSTAVAQTTGSVIFIHPDGAGSASWAAARALYVGPDGDLHWDRLPHIAVYRGHMLDSLTATSNGGATTHATGRKVYADAFGMNRAGDKAQRIVDGNGRYLSVAIQAMDAGLPVGIVQSGAAIEPGTAVFLTDARHRGDFDAIARGLLDSNAPVILGGGEKYFLPEGVQGRHGKGTRKDGQNLIELAAERGYTIVYIRDELRALSPTSPEATKVLGIFASSNTFNDRKEEDLAASKLPMYAPDAPTIGEMTDFALKRLSRDGQRFLLVVEEEGTDNFGNNNNASGMLEAMRRADEAIGVARRFVAEHPDTLLITAADSDAGGMKLVGLAMGDRDTPPDRLPERDSNGSPQDGVDGTASRPFLAAPDRHGRRLPFAIVWAAHGDLSGGILVRAEGFNAHLVRGSMDNTQIPELIRLTLFGQSVPTVNAGHASTLTP